MEVIFKTILIGVGATLLMDIWAMLLKQFGIQPLNFAFVGRWIGSLPKGIFFHHPIFNSPKVKGELFIGWLSHYLIGITFSALLVVLYGTSWLHSPTFFPAILIGVLTTVAPFFIMQPAFGFGIAASKTPTPGINRLKSLVAHGVYGLGLYLVAIGLNHFAM